MTDVDIWAKIEARGQAQPSNAAAEDVPAAAPPIKFPKWLFPLLDGISAVVWIYVVLDLFVFDVGTTVLGTHAVLYQYRFLFFLALLTILAVTLRARAILVVGYVVLFPLLLLVWKIPRLIYRSRSWVAFLAAMNAVVAFFQGFRYDLVVKTLALFAGLAIIESHSPIVLWPAMAYMGFLLIASFVRTVRHSFQRSRFVTAQERFVVGSVDSKLVRSLTDLNPALLRPEVTVFDDQQITLFTNSLAFSILSNRVLYLWAYQLDRYRKSPASYLFTVFSYVWLFLGTVTIFSLLNIAVLHLDAHAFTYTHYPSYMLMVAYSITSLFVSSIEGVAASSDLALFLRVVAAIFGPLLLFTVISNMVFNRRTRDDAAFDEAVQRIKQKGIELKERVHTDFNVDIEEAGRRLSRLNVDLWVRLIDLISALIPKDFYGT